jgi:hypothetical protein
MLHLWMYDHWHDFAQHSDLFDSLKTFVHENVNGSSLRFYAKDLTKLLNMRVRVRSFPSPQGRPHLTAVAE